MEPAFVGHQVSKAEGIIRTPAPSVFLTSLTWNDSQCFDILHSGCYQACA